MKTGWTLIENPFETSTVNNYSKMLKLCTFTHSALKSKSADPFYLNLYNSFHPLVESYQQAYNIWHSAAGNKKAGSLNLTILLKQLSHPLIGQWNAAVQNQYLKRTPRYKEIFGYGVKPFHNGSKEDRISAVYVLAKCIGADASLATLKTEIEAYAQLLDTARTKQLGGKNLSKNKSAEVESLRLQLAVAMMAIYGKLVVRYAQELEMIEMFFDVETLRDKRQKVFTRKLKPHQHKTLVKRTLAPDDELKLHNTGAAELLIGLCLAKGMACTTGVNIAAGKTLTVTASQLGDVANYKFITLTNLTAYEGSCVVTLV